MYRRQRQQQGDQAEGNQAEKREDNNDSSVIVETVIQEKEVRSQNSDHIIIFPNTALLDEHTQKQMLSCVSQPNLTSAAPCRIPAPSLIVGPTQSRILAP